MKCVESNTDVWDLKAMLENSELFSKKSNGEYDLYSPNAPTYMLNQFIEYGVYRKVEREVKEESRWVVYEDGKFKCEISEAPTEYDYANYQIIEITVEV